MTRKCSTLLSAAGQAAVGLAFLFGCAGLSAMDTNDVLNGWFAAQANLRGWSADFTQTRTLRTLVQPLTTPGHLWFAPPDNFRWELGRPAQTIAVRHGPEMFLIYPRLARAEHYTFGTNSPAQWRDAMALLQAGFPQNRAGFDTQFKLLALAETNGTWVLKLQPKSAFAAKMMPGLQVELATNSFSLAATELVFTDGSRMRTDFTNAVVNPNVDRAIFEWTPPPDHKVTEPFASKGQSR